MHWYCLKTQTHKERIAEAVLDRQLGLEVLCPRIRKRVKTPVKGWRRRTEPLFPGYCFARFDLGTGWRQVTHAQGVAGIVRFNNHVPVLPETVIAELRSLPGEEEADPPSAFRPGDRVEITDGPLAGLTAQVWTLDRKQRVHLLLDLLGSHTVLQGDSLVHLEE